MSYENRTLVFGGSSKIKFKNGLLKPGRGGCLESSLGCVIGSGALALIAYGIFVMLTHF